MSQEQKKKKWNNDTELDTQWIIIYWKQGGWKTTIWLVIAFENWKGRIYSNFQIKCNWEQINRDLRSIKDVKNIGFSMTPWVIIIDEAWINASSYDTRSWNSRILQEVLFLARKKNCSFIWIAQRYESIDINARLLADVIIRMSKIRRYKKKPIFKAKRIRQKWTKEILVNSYTIDTLKIMENWWLTYNTREASKFDWKEKKENQKTPP